MDSIIMRSAVIYIFIFIILRLGGKRTVGEMTTFDLVLLLIISEATQQALLDDDRSITGGMLAITTLVFLDIVVSLLTNKNKGLDNLLNGVPLIIVKDGKPLMERIKKSRLQIEDILEAGRKFQGIESLAQIRYAVLEKDGTISIIPVNEKTDT
ncbi:uncharacterized protein DUF421 [Arcticibacter tournemirensis]|uniref:DUF421 domain-containing protein n=1 Tax=Arcticibacter tournemirensis TaxID=699437 RepID=A0A5M9GVA4_9SPHI|nr:YetF domain-containing protein [Arcticibacter tournemirensis]KAA8478536.1 DUF421 domain-containing protein [Arcticibacter tournemirensis]TQM51116.1 uncharacterized protein DUF421 [Arcticibacter tournemirensis]